MLKGGSWLRDSTREISCNQKVEIECVCRLKEMQIGKKKLVLDHLIVQSMGDDEDDTSMQSILTFGAQALFDSDQSTRDITCTICHSLLEISPDN